jgi:ribosomal-protein-serine acetyltransferase
MSTKSVSNQASSVPVTALEKKFPPEKIDGLRIELRKHELGLAEKMFAYVDQDRDRLRQFLPWVDSTLTVEDERKFIEFTHAQWAEFKLFDFGIFRKSDGEYLGNVGVHHLEWASRGCELGYWILGNFEGQGYMSEAVQTLERAMFELGFHRIEIRCSTLNQRSASVPMRCGYRLEAMLTEGGIDVGRYRDTLIFAKLEGGAKGERLPTRVVVHRPIGWVRSSRNEKRDDAWDSERASIALDPVRFGPEALAGLDAFSHVEVLFQMDQVESHRAEHGARHPRGNTAWPRVGIFAQRAKDRPNPIGLSVCRVKAIRGLEVELEGLDAIDGTPVLDLKPWVREFGPRGEVRQPAWMAELMQRYWD